MLVNDDECRGKGNGDQGRGDNPYPAPERKRYDNRDGRERFAAALQRRVNDGRAQRWTPLWLRSRHQHHKLYRTPTTRIENAEAPFATAKAVHFCPGTVGGAEWNGPAYDPQTNLILIGEVDWCATVTLQKGKDIRAVSPGKPWSAMATISPYDTYGVQDAFGDWAGWVYAADADTGFWKWRLKSNYPILSGMTPTAGGIVFFGDMVGNFYALNAANGQRPWGQKIGGAIGGGVITYTAKGAERVAVATGFTSILWPTEVVTGKITVLGLADALANR